MASIVTTISEVLLAEGSCSSEEEAEVLAELIAGDEGDDPVEFDVATIENALQEYLDVSDEKSKELATLLKAKIRASEGEESEDDETTSVGVEGPLDDVDDEAEVLFDGECELCDRYIKLTKHHLIPKSTWPRIQTKLQHAAAAKQKGDVERALAILGDGLEYLLDRIDGEKQSIRLILHTTCDICRQCHTAVHKAHDNMDLALYYSSVEKLLTDQQIYKFCKWASKQRAGKYKHNM